MTSLLKLLGLNTGIINNIDSAHLEFTHTLATFMLLLIFMVPITLFLCKFEGKPISKKTKNKLIALRILWVILLSAIAAGPVLVIIGMVPEKSKIAVLIDTSKSMGIKNKNSNGKEVSRLDTFKTLIQNGFIDKIENKTSVKPDIYTFSDILSQMSNQELRELSIEANGNQTNLNSAIKNVAGNLGGSGLLGIIALTDGSYTAGGNPLNEAMNMKTPIHFVMPNIESNKSDMAISLRNPPTTAYLNSGIRVKGEVSVYGSPKTPIKVEVTKDNQVFSTLSIPIKADERKTEFTLNIPCNQEGNFKYEFKIPPISDELTTDNNSSSFLLKVVKERINILALSGNPSWELKFMSNAAMSDPNTHFTYFCKLFENKWAVSEDMKPASSTINPGILNAIRKSDVIVLNGIDYKDIRAFESEIINKVETGTAGILIMSSNKTFAQLGYSESEISKLLPVNIENEKNQTNSGSYFIPNKNNEYAFLKIIDDSNQNADFFASLPKPEGISDFGEVKIGAEILLGISVNGKSTIKPFMIKSRYGRGNVLMTTGGPLWSSGFKLIPTEHGFTPYSAIIVNMFKFLANRHEDAQVSLELPTDKNLIGSPSVIKIWVSDNKHQLLANAQTSVSIITPDNAKISVPCSETSEKGCYEATYIPQANGIFKIEAEASHKGRLVGKTNGEILVEIPTAEYDNPEINSELMQKIASATGGICVYTNETERLISSLTNVTGEKIATKAIDLRDSWLLLLIILALPAIEWYIRRTGGLS